LKDKKIIKTIIKMKSNAKFLSGIKDVDLLILMELDDVNLFNACKINKESARICQDEDFWKKRFVHKYGDLYKNKRNISWRKLYLKAMSGYNLFRMWPNRGTYVSETKIYNDKDQILLVDIDSKTWKEK
jgi:hypothetical protein